MANSGQTIVTVKKWNGSFTRVNKYQQYLLQYEAGEARPHISLDVVNSQFLKEANLQENQTYVMFWKEIGTTPNPNGGENPRYRMDFKFVDTTDAVAWMIKLKQLQDVYGDQSVIEDQRRKSFKKNAQVSLQQVNEQVTAGDEEDF